MDVCVKFWGREKNSADACYLISKFLGHSSARFILQAFLGGIKGLNLSDMALVLMDGPAANLKFFESLKSYCLQCEFPKLFNIGSWGLHIFHEAFKSGAEAISCQLKAILKIPF